MCRKATVRGSHKESFLGEARHCVPLSLSDSLSGNQHPAHEKLRRTPVSVGCAMWMDSPHSTSSCACYHKITRDLILLFFVETRFEVERVRRDGAHNPELTKSVSVQEPAVLSQLSLINRDGQSCFWEVDLQGASRHRVLPQVSQVEFPVASVTIKSRGLEGWWTTGLRYADPEHVAKGQPVK